MNKIKVALVGCGRIAETKHLPAIAENAADLELVAVCDANAERADEVAAQYKVKAYTDLKQMLEAEPELDLVALCTSSGLHAEQAIMCMQHGCNVVTEKPMACNLSDAEQMVAVAEQATKQLFVVKQNRLNPAVQLLKRAIDNGDFGKIYMVHCNVFWTRPQEYYDVAPWRGTWKYDGGAFMNQASHYVDLLEYLIGKVDSVQAVTKTLARNIETEDSGVVNLVWKNGAIGSMAVTMLTYPKNLEGSITILGEKGTVRLDGAGLGDVKVWQFEASQLDPEKDLSSVSYGEFSSGHGAYYKNVADVLLRGGKPITDALSGLCSIQLLDAIYKSSVSGNMQSVA